MYVPKPTLQQVAHSAAGLASLTGVYGFLAMMGAFGPVSCWTSKSASQTAIEPTSGGEVVTSSEITVTHGCEAGIDYLFRSTSGNAPVLFFWSVVLLGLVTLGGAAVLTGHRYITWISAVVGVIISIIGVMSIGWYFMLPTLFLLIAATALTVKARRGIDGGPSTPT
jgi:hypothetical protein